MTPELDEPSHLADRISGVLLGTALGDALGLPAEGMSARSIARRFGRMDRFRLLGRTGFVSDDTEQSALIAQSLARFPDDLEGCVRAFRRALLAWFGRLPWGVGLATVRACGRIALGLSPSGVNSAGNGASMRAAPIGALFSDRPAERLAFGRALAEVTHRDPRAVEGALFVAEVTGACLALPPDGSHADAIRIARSVVRNPELGDALDRAATLAARGATVADAAAACGTTGFVLHTVPFAAFVFERFGDDPMSAWAEAIGAGGDTDSIGAILGAWLGARHGESGLPASLIDQLNDGPFGPTHLRALARALVAARNGRRDPVPRYSALRAMARNVALYPVILGHGFRRLIPF